MRKRNGHTCETRIAQLIWKSAFLNQWPRRRTNRAAHSLIPPLRLIKSLSAMDQHRDLTMGKDLDRLAAEDNRGNAVAAMRSHDD